ncbi:MAG: DUF3352 domain-containing protein [Bacteroides sp.]|nr:DUF3352 domain-containing protein [Bacteroides sp.]
MEQEELNTGTPIPGKRKIPYPKLMKWGGGFAGIYIIWLLLYFFLSPDRNTRQIYLIPQDAVFILHSAEPVKDWHTFSRSDSWNSLKRFTFLKEAVEQAESLDSLIRENETLLSLIGKRDMLISVHKTRPDDWDALMIVDLQKTSKINLLRSQLENIFRIAGFNVTSRNYKTSTILEAFDPESRDILYTAFVDNHFVASYTSRLVEAAIEECEDQQIGLNPAFQEVDKIVTGRGVYRLYVNYEQLVPFLSLYMEDNEYLSLFSQSMEFSGVYFNVFPEKLEAKGYTIRKDTANPYLTALLSSGRQTLKAHHILSARTALYINVGFDNPSLFVKQLKKAMDREGPGLYQTYRNSRRKIENLFGISLEENFLSWMSGEFALAHSEASLLGKEPETILVICARRIKDARKNMEILEKRIKNRTPVRVRTVDYKKYDIHYIEMKGFFRLFFGKLFDTFEKPYYTYLEDYVVFSNSAASLLSFLEDYEQKNLLKNSPVFKKAYADFAGSSTLFLYADTHRFSTASNPSEPENLAGTTNR